MELEYDLGRKEVSARGPFLNIFYYSSYTSSRKKKLEEVRKWKK